MAYATLAELQDRVTANPDRSDVLQDCLDAATAAVDRFTNRNFDLAATASARVYLATNTGRVSVDDIGSLTDLVVKTGRPGAFTTTIDSSSYWLQPLNALAASKPYEWVYTDDAFSIQAYPTVEVTAKWGWPAVPAEIKEATLLMAARLFARKDSPTGVAGFGDYGVVRVTASDADVARLLSPYFRVASN